MMENPIKMDDLGVQLFLETPILPNYHPYTTGQYNPLYNRTNRA